MNYSDWLMRDVASAMGWALVHSVWQGLVIAAVLAILLRMLARSSPSVRYILACLGLLVMVGSVGGTLAKRFPEWPRHIYAPSLSISKPAALPTLMEEFDFHSINPRRSGMELEQMLPWMVAAWLAGVLALSTWQLGGWLLLRRYRRAGQGADPQWKSRLNSLAVAMGTRRVELIITHQLDVPIVLGAFKPYILMPAAVLSNLSVAQVEAILAHELAHVRRYDYLANLLQSAIETIFFYHPAVWWISRQIRKEREFCCDDLAAEACGDRAGYARALAALEQSRITRLAVAAGGAGGGELLMRVRRLLGQPVDVRPLLVARPRSWAAAMLVVAGGIAIAIGSQRLVAQPTRTPTTAPSAGPATNPATAPTVGTAIRPEDLVATRSDYRIGANDLVQLTITDLVGPGVETMRVARVSERGMIDVPLLGAMTAEGLTDSELARQIGQGYRDKSIIMNANVSVLVMEARNRMFSIYGAVRNPGQYQIVDSNFRLFHALSLARGTTTNTDIRVTRPSNDPANPRTIEISGAAVASGDPKVNIVILPNDLIFVAQPRRIESSQMTPAENAELQKALNQAVASAEETWSQLKLREQAGEAMTLSFVQLLFDTAKRVADAKVSAAIDPNIRVAAIEEYLQRCTVLTTTLQNRLGQDVTQVQISQAKSTMEIARAELIRRKAEARQASEPQVIRVLANETQVFVDGKSTDWAGIRKKVLEIPEADRSRAVIEVAAATKGMSVSRFFTVEREAKLLAGEVGLGGVQNAGVDPSATERPIGEYYLGGRVPRGGVYSLSGREITLRAAIIAAGGPEAGAEFVDVQRKVDGRSQLLLQNASLDEIFAGKVPDIVLQPDDQIMVGVPPAPGK